MRQTLALVAAPSVVSHTVFVNPKYRGKRLYFDESAAMVQLQQIYVRKQFRVHDARALLEQAPSLDSMGFQLVDAPIRMDFFDRELVKTRFYDYCVDLVKAVTGCVAGKVVQHEFRNGGPIGKGGYAPAAHGDVCPYVEDILDIPEGRHFALYNIWRSIDPEREIEMMPLALCDGTTVLPADMVHADSLRHTEPPTRLVDYRLVHNLGQCWYYYPRMTPDETLLFVQYDTRREDANRRVAFHTAFKDPTTRAGAPLRQSVEARVLAVFRDEDTDREDRQARFQAEIPRERLDGTLSSSRYEVMVDWNRGRPLVD